MDFIQFIGFLISMAALIFVSIKRAREEKRRQAHPEEFQHEKEEESRAYKQLLKSLQLPIPDELHDPRHAAPRHAPPRPPPAASSKGWKAPEVKRTVRPSFQFQANLDARHQKTRVEQRNYQNRIAQRQQFTKSVVSEALQPEAATTAYDIREVSEVAMSEAILNNLKVPVHMVLFHELLSKPAGMRKIGPLEGLPWEYR